MLDVEVILCDLTHDYQVVATNKMPLGIAMIASYAKKIFPQISVSLFKQIAELEKYIKKLSIEKNGTKIIVGFSNFIWNQNLNLKIANIIKQVLPASIVVFGGPNFPLGESERAEFLFSNPQIDFYIPFEGEASFANFMDVACGCNFDIEKIKDFRPAQTAYVYDSRFISTSSLNRINISEIPSPYTTGLMDSFFGVYKPLVQFTRGCPFKCAYCSEGGDHWGKVYRKQAEDVEEELEYIAARSDCRETLHISDSNFGMYKNDIAYAKIIANKRKKYNWPSSILVATGKNSKETVLEVAKILEGQMPLSASVQSTDSEVLKNVNRKNIKLQDIFAVGLSAKEYGANTYADIILALPGDTIQAHKKTLKDVIDADIDFTTPFQFMMLKGTHLASESSKKEYRMQSRYRVLPRCFGSYYFLNNKFIAAEVEEICVANLTLSFNDYIEARRLHLLIDIFYNHRSLQEIYLVLGEFGISNFSFIEQLHELDKGLLSKVFDDFENETKNELWSTSEELLGFISNEENLQKYKTGEIGANLLYKYRITSLMYYSKDVVYLAYEALENLLTDKLGSDYRRYEDFICQLKDLSQCRIDRFMDTAMEFERTYDYDLISLGDRTVGELIAEKKKTKIIVRHEEEYKSVIEYYQKENGISIISLSKILSQVNVKKCFRKGIYAAS